MTFAEDVLAKLFTSEQSPFEPLVHEPLRRTRRDRSDFQLWKKAGVAQELSRLFSLASYLKRNGIRCSVNVHLLSSDVADAFSVSCSDSIDSKSFQHYFDYLRERILIQGYLPHRSEREISDRVLYVETIERHTFQIPQYEDEKGRTGQLYGNLYLELTRVNDRPSYFKLMATHHAAEGHCPHLPFGLLLKRILV